MLTNTNVYLAHITSLTFFPFQTQTHLLFATWWSLIARFCAFSISRCSSLSLYLTLFVPHAGTLMFVLSGCRHSCTKARSVTFSLTRAPVSCSSFQTFSLQDRQSGTLSARQLSSPLPLELCIQPEYLFITRHHLSLPPFRLSSAKRVSALKCARRSHSSHVVVVLVVVAVLVVPLSAGLFQEEKAKKKKHSLLTTAGSAQLFASQIFVELGVGRGRKEKMHLCIFFWALIHSLAHWQAILPSSIVIATPRSFLATFFSLLCFIKRCPTALCCSGWWCIICHWNAQPVYSSVLSQCLVFSHRKVFEMTYRSEQPAIAFPFSLSFSVI